MKKSFIILIMLLITFSAFAAVKPVELSTTVKKAVLFKNGLSFFIRSGEVYYNGSGIELDTVPDAFYGSLWMYCRNKDTDITNIKSYINKESIERDASSFYELLKSNISRKVSITYLNSKKISGIIHSLPVYSQDIEPTPININNVNRKYAANMLVLKTKDGFQVIKISTINQLQFMDKNPSFRISDEKYRRRIQFDLTKKNINSKISIMYFRKDIGWSPSYLLDISDKENAVLTLKAMLINDAEDVINSDIDLAVGFPNFLFSNIKSPMSLQSNLSSFLSSINRQGSRSYSSNRLSNVLVQSAEQGFAGAEDDFNYSEKTNSMTKVEDLYFYNLKGIDLKKNTRLSKRIFSEKVKYSHLYFWEIPETSTVSSSGYYRSTNGNYKDQVWHILKLKNVTSFPWTTAPVFTIKNSKPIAQDIMNFTTQGGETSVKLTVASDIKVDRFEEEKDRKRGIKMKSFSGSYDYITIKGTLYLKNTRKEMLPVEIRKKITGEVQEADYNPNIKKEGGELKSVNIRSEIKWNFKLKANEERKINYTYKIYIRS